ncbi:hypothetical protein [Streptomyces sp. 900105245]
MAMPVDFQLISVDDDYVAPAIHRLTGVEPRNRQEHIDTSGKFSKIVLHSKYPYKNFKKWFETAVELETEGHEKKPKLITAPDSRGTGNDVEWSGIWMRYGTYDKALGASTKAVDVLNPIDMGWPLSLHTEGGKIDWTKLPEEWQTSTVQIATEQWNIFATLIARAGAAIAHPLGAAGGIVAGLLAKVMVKEDFYIVLSTSPFSASVKGEVSAAKDDAMRCWRFSTTEKGLDVQTQIPWSVPLQALDSHFTDDEKNA